MKIGDLVMHVRDPNGFVGMIYAWVYDGYPDHSWAWVMWSHAENGRSSHPLSDLEVVT